MSDILFKFEVGQLVLHLRYGYRGVIFERDPICTADQAWYLNNQYQPDRDQPWYHVMVDGAQHTTYVAESNLKPDPTGEPIVHPWLDRVFEQFHNGHYAKQNLN